MNFIGPLAKSSLGVKTCLTFYHNVISNQFQCKCCMTQIKYTATAMNGAVKKNQAIGLWYCNRMQELVGDYT